MDDLEEVVSAFSVVTTIADNVRRRAMKTGDAYLVGGIDELISAIRSLQEKVTIKIARNGIAIQEEKEKAGAE
jgi:hypothetical protein